MSRLPLYPESHFVDRIGWLRAAVLGANDGILSTASLIVGVAAAAATQNNVLIAGVAGHTIKDEATGNCTDQMDGLQSAWRPRLHRHSNRLGAASPERIK